MPSIYALSFDTGDWELAHDSPQQIVLRPFPSDTLFVEFKQPTDFKRDVLDPDLRLEFEQGANQSGAAIVEFDVVKLKGLEAIRQIYKYWHPAPRNMRKVYIGTLAFPFADYCYIFRVQCVETRTTGMREAGVTLILSDQKPEKPQGDPIPLNSMEELFERIKKALLTRTASDDELYDVHFPEHPLAKARAYLRHFSETLIVDPALRKAKSYRVAVTAKPRNLLDQLRDFFGRFGKN
ncbi:MAG: hypothetical protein ACT4QE_03755 [Anaerolineales bacterium]